MSNWGCTFNSPVTWLWVAVTENYASWEALANGPLTNTTVTGPAMAYPSGWRKR